MICLATLAALPAREDPVPVKTRAKPAQAASDPYALAAQIDELILKNWEAQKVVPAPPADDAEFMRRVYLDLTGRIPRVSEARAFLEDNDPLKRRKLVNRLIDGDPADKRNTNANYVTHFTNTWRALLLPQSNDPQVQNLSPQFEVWLRKRFKENTPYNKMVFEILTANLGGGQVQPVLVPGQQPGGPIEPTPVAFYQANENKPENLAAATSRLFFCVKVECAQCHDHPFAKWTRNQFWEYAAFFSGLQPRGRNPNQMAFDPKSREIEIPNAKTKTIVQAKFLDGIEPKWKDDDLARTVLADWATSPENPFFARATANRIWAHFFGIGIVEPVDEFSEENPPSHPELLDALAKGLIDNDFDIKFLIRAITASRAYQLTSETTDKSQEDIRVFARMPIKGMSPEQFFDSLARATGYESEIANRQQRDNGFASARAEFLARFSNPVDKKTEHQTSILQALAIMNGRFVGDAVDPDNFGVEFMFGKAARDEFSMQLHITRRIGAVYDAPFLDTRGKLDTLYLSVLSRPMRPGEAEKMVTFVESGGKRKDSRKALADVYWALLNCSEFMLNH
jgi:hypothetical protein